ncbi:MAG: Do family serine endopeptidase [Pseudomonadota bacterium]
MTANRNTPATRPRRLESGLARRIAASGAARLGAVGLAVGLAIGSVASDRAAVEASLPQLSANGTTAAGGLPASFADLVDATRPSVVGVLVQGRAPAGLDLQSLPRSHPLRRFFERDGAPSSRGVGSGFVVSDDGYIVTNHHVIEHADDIQVVLHDGTRVQAKVHGTDARTDLALLKIATDEPLRPVRFGDSEQARVGDWVIAVGSPFGLGGTYTAGIISARGRDINAGPYDDFLQIDASINRGNSGGALFNTAGEVIGVNTAIYSPNGGNVGIGFAVPAALATAVIDDLRDDGKVARGWLGVQIQALTPALAESLGLKRAAGALVTEVSPGGPAAAAGLAVGDVITAVGDRKVAQMRDLPRLIATTAAGTDVELSVWRGGESLVVKAEIGTLADSGQAAGPAPAQLEDTVESVGVQVASVSEDLRQRYGLEPGTGLVVTGLKAGSPAARAGLRPGMVIERASSRALRVPSDFAQSIVAARAGEAGSMLLLVRDQRGTRRFVALAIA